MKKAWIFLIVLALLALSVPVFADGPTVSYHMQGYWWLNVDPTISTQPSTINSGAERMWPTLDVAFDANNTMEIGLRLWNGTVSNTANAFTNVIGPQGSLVAVTGATSLVPVDQLGNSLWHWMWTSDLTKAAGLGDIPVDVKLSIGLQDVILDAFWYDNNGWEYEYGGWSKVPGSNWDSGLITVNSDSNFLGYHWAVAIGPVTFDEVNDFLLQNTLVDATVAYMGVGFGIAYGYYGTEAGFGASQSNLNIEAKYDVPQFSGITLKPSIFFRDAVSPSNWVFGGDLTIAYTMFKLIVGATTTSTYALQHYSATLLVAPVAPASIFIAAYLDGATPDSAPLQAVNIGGSYMFGAFKLYLGWLIGGKDQLGQNNANGSAGDGNNVTLGPTDDAVGAIRNGFYFGSGINF